jgi:hypothetical protein
MSIFCPPLAKTIIAVNNAASPVILTINGNFSELAQNHFFRLFLSRDIFRFQAANVNPVSVSDSTGAQIALTQGSTGNVVHFDQLKKLLARIAPPFHEAVLECFFGNDGPAENVLHINVNTRLPRTDFVATPAAIV